MCGDDGWASVEGVKASKLRSAARDVARPSRNQSQTGLNAEKRREKELSATLGGSLRLCVKSSQLGEDAVAGAEFGDIR
jgi:ribonuclease PH